MKITVYFESTEFAEYFDNTLNSAEVLNCKQIIQIYFKRVRIIKIEY